MARGVTEDKGAAKTGDGSASKAAVKSSTRRTSRSKAKPADGSTGVPAEKRLRPIPDIQRHADIETRRAFPAICEALLKRARKGAIQHTKLLIHIGKLEEKPSRRKRADKSLSAMLMDELQRAKAEASAVEAAEGAGAKE